MQSLCTHSVCGLKKNMDDISYGGLKIFIVFVISFDHVTGLSSRSTTPRSTPPLEITPGDPSDSRSGFKIYPTVFVVFVLALMICCLGTCCGVTARRRANLQRRRAAQQRQMVNGYATLMIAVIADLMSNNGQDGQQSAEPEEPPPRTEFKGPPTYDEVTKVEGDAPPPYTSLDLSRSVKGNYT